MEITVITPTMPHRADMLAECVASVEAQTLPAVAHLIGVDPGDGQVPTQNRLWPQVETEWIQVLADDDLLYPDHLHRLAGRTQLAATEPPFHEPDIVYSYCAVEGRPGWNPNVPFEESRLQIPATALIRRSLVEELGGWQLPGDGNFEDHDFWHRATEAGATFACLQAITWTYRFHGDNLSWKAKHD